MQREFLLWCEPRQVRQECDSTGYDEVTFDGVRVRPHWRALCDVVSELPSAEMAARWSRAQQEISENGLSFHVHGDISGQGRRWQLDPLPFPVERDEWRRLSDGLKQRARLLNAILTDLYGPRLLLRERILPAAIVLGNPAFLRPCVGIKPPKGSHLHLYGADLARDNNGGWRVMADRTDVVAGIGYALENRQIISRLLPEALGSFPIRPIASFVDTVRAALHELSPRRFDTPRIVLLTPGTHSDSYFEQAYLAQHLGCMMAEAADLTARDDRIFLKTLDGLRPVDVILRNTASGMCDPLELDGGSSRGIAGLVSAMRAGSVAVVNMPGCGIVESPALAAYLPALCMRLLGEPLALPSVPTWWCGNPEAAAHVAANLDGMVIRNAHDGNAPAIFGDKLDETGRAGLLAAMAARPHDFVAQDIMPLSTAPVWSDGQLISRHVSLRAFLAATDKGEVVMDGGLTRVSSARSLPTMAVRSGEGGCKDTWVREEADCAPIPTPTAPILRLTRSGFELTSRLADNLFWFGRYLERCEDMTRMLRVLFARPGTAAPGVPPGTLPFRALLSQLGLSTTKARAFTAPAQALAELGRLHFDPTYSVGLRANTDRLLHTASAIRDRLSLDTWRNVQRIHREVGGLADAHTPEQVSGGLNTLILTLEAASGLVMENMTRGIAWRFLDIGRRLERATHMVELLSVAAQADAAEAPSMLEALLAISDSSMTYRARYLGQPQLGPVLDLLMCDESNPRSAAFQFAQLSDHLDNVLLRADPPRLRADQRLMVFLTGTVRTADIDVLTQGDEDGGLFKLNAALAVLRSRLWELSETVTRDFFTHASRKDG